ncbi:MAG: hypothetical protein J0653_06020, partial [Deltaproteobacteria bacterium]|nr:hypothetical protein [Deltaproteobacteria bacterium]
GTIGGIIKNATYNIFMQQGLHLIVRLLLSPQSVQPAFLVCYFYEVSRHEQLKSIKGVQNRCLTNSGKQNNERIGNGYQKYQRKSIRVESPKQKM